MGRCKDCEWWDGYPINYDSMFRYDGCCHEGSESFDSMRPACPNFTPKDGEA